MKNFLNTATGSYLKIFITIVIGIVITHGSIWGINWKEFANTAIISFLPIIVNALNPNDPRYGIGKDKEIKI